MSYYVTSISWKNFSFIFSSAFVINVTVNISLPSSELWNERTYSRGLFNVKDGLHRKWENHPVVPTWRLAAVFYLRWRFCSRTSLCWWVGSTTEKHGILVWGYREHHSKKLIIFSKAKVQQINFSQYKKNSDLTLLYFINDNIRIEYQLCLQK